MSDSTCTACGAPPADRYVVSMHGEATCVQHPTRGQCALCARPRHTGESGWSRFTSATVRCPTCAGQAVDTQEEARLHIPAVRTGMAALGIELDQRVRVTLVEPDAINTDVVSLCLGRTLQRTWADRATTDVLGIEIARGLTTTHFGATVAHEIGHAWLAQRGARNLSPPLEEGVCELFSGAWLKRQRTEFASTLRRVSLESPDPVYGAGYRMVRDSVVSHGVAAVLDSVCRRGCLP
ncbi:protein DA1 [Umezawaea tangerina]|uniref:Protein DA1 n=1 Tax=Umezawaea tangerina TaxID=84725 RepID=A0A2T0SLH4_9PSEU|nr:protein DA1 [Umezawaea tangerina]PRY34258.1 protein DA1 [Umezawaea tangerina]